MSRSDAELHTVTTNVHAIRLVPAELKDPLVALVLLLTVPRSDLGPH
jgi:hypothetical protein